MLDKFQNIIFKLNVENFNINLLKTKQIIYPELEYSMSSIIVKYGQLINREFYRVYKGTNVSGLYLQCLSGTQPEINLEVKINIDLSLLFRSEIKFFIAKSKKEKTKLKRLQQASFELILSTQNT
ncbi:hypothetical protein BpHYR1_015486 [Brachionus plicatilis]|uniref:Uncharacterized protein n=1 Tax=Brachionus plicatilis TaxID=10195 RepID=A0A3M7T0M4_BRAPC|nr:hypothetical protein BpHYR1_015486 [Brachionus plicatilis]